LINTVLGSINGTLVDIEGDLVVIETTLGTIQTELEGWSAFTLSSAVGDSTYQVWFLSTSTIISSSYSDNMFTLELEGADGTQGLTHVWIPTAMLEAIGSDTSQLAVTIDGESVEFETSSYTDRVRVSFAYSHSEHTVDITLTSTEFPLLLIISIIGSIGVILVVAVILRKRIQNS
jgi:hypothetical protein